MGRSDLRLRRWLIVAIAFALITSLSWAVTAERAAACSCTAPSLSTATHDSAFVGVITEREVSPDGDVVATYAVEQWLEGDLHQDTVEISTDRCGTAALTSEPVAVRFNAANSMCTFVFDNFARANLVPLAVHPEAGPARWALSDTSSDWHLRLLDEQGLTTGFTERRLVTAASGPRATRQCAGTSSWAEAWPDWDTNSILFAIRDLATLRTTDRLQVPNLRRFDLSNTSAATVGCYSASGAGIWTAALARHGDGQSTLYNPASGIEIIVATNRSFVTQVVFEAKTPSAIALSHDAVTRVDLLTQQAQTLVDLTSYETNEDNGASGFATVNPDGSIVAVYLDRLTWPGVTIGALVLFVDLETGAVIEVGRAPGETIDILYETGTWFGNDRFLLAGKHGNPDIALDATSGTYTTLGDTLASGDSDRTLTAELLSAISFQVRFVDPFTGEIRNLEQLDGVEGTITLLDPAVTVTAELPRSAQQYCLGLPATVVIAEGDLPTPGDDVIVGTPQADTIAAGGGADIICAGDGDDIIWGQGGDDIVYGGAGDDRVRGGAGDDHLHGESGADNLGGGSGNDIVLGGLGDDVGLRGGPGDDVVHGGNGDDRLISGNAGNDIVRGGQEDDVVLGGPGNDLLEGGSGDDLIRGHGGDDILRGNEEQSANAADSLFGGAGDDSLDAGPSGSCNGGDGVDTGLSCGDLVSIEN